MDRGFFGALDSGWAPASVDPVTSRAADFGVVGTVANTALYYRVRDGGTISKIAVEVTASSGNISVAVYSNSGAGSAAVPASRKATSGSVACPAIGQAEISLGGSVTVVPGDWLAISSDNVNAAFRALLTSETTNALGAGRIYKQASAHPLPATPASLTAITGRALVLVGIA
jgi:hypothetical protein